MSSSNLKEEDEKKTKKIYPSLKPNLSLDMLKKTGLINLTDEQKSRSVYVTNISSKATLKNVSDFFSYCGHVEKLVQDFDPTSDLNNVKQFAVVVFDNESSCSTALLCGNVTILDSNINIFPYTELRVENISNNSKKSESSLKKGRNATDVISAIVEAGYVKGSELIKDMKKKANELDNSTHISEKVNLAYNYSLKKCKEIDSSLHISSTVISITGKAVEGVGKIYKKLDDSIGIEKTAKATKETVKSFTDNVMKNETVKQGVDIVSSVATSGWSFVTNSWNFWTAPQNEEKKNLIDEEKEEKVEGKKESEKVEEKKEKKTEEIKVQQEKKDDKVEEKKVEEKKEENKKVEEGNLLDLDTK